MLINHEFIVFLTCSIILLVIACISERKGIKPSLFVGVVFGLICTTIFLEQIGKSNKTIFLAFFISVALMLYYRKDEVSNILSRPHGIENPFEDLYLGAMLLYYVPFAGTIVYVIKDIYRTFNLHAFGFFTYKIGFETLNIICCRLFQPLIKTKDHIVDMISSLYPSLSGKTSNIIIIGLFFSIIMIILRKFIIIYDNLANKSEEPEGIPESIRDSILLGFRHLTLITVSNIFCSPYLVVFTFFLFLLVPLPNGTQLLGICLFITTLCIIGSVLENISIKIFSNKYINDTLQNSIPKLIRDLYRLPG